MFPLAEADGVTGGRRVLVLDDDKAIRELLEDALSARGYEVVLARDARSALEQIAHNPPALILLDLRLRGMDGAEFARAYRRFPGRHAPTIVVSAADDAAAQARELGAQAHLRKPFDVDELIGLVERYAGTAA